LKTDIFDSKSKLLALGRREALKRGFGDTVDCIYSHHEHPAVGIRKGREHFRNFAANIYIECAFVFDAVAFVEFGAEGMDVLNRDWPFQEQHWVAP
jgi:hypothetical protein